MSGHTPVKWSKKFLEIIVKTDGMDNLMMSSTRAASLARFTLALMGTNADMLEALKRIKPYTMPEMTPPPGKQYEHYQASVAVHEAIAKAEVV